MKKSILLLFVALLTLNGFSQAPVPTTLTDNTGEDELKILSWNIYMLPILIRRSGQVKRAEIIAEQLKSSEYDVIVFQEAFNHKARKKMWSIIKEAFPYQAGPLNNADKPIANLNGGIWIVSKQPLNVLGEIEFNDCKGLDCVALKGAMLVEVTKGDRTYQVMGTHLQADEGESRDLIRKKQCEQIRDELLAPNAKDHVPQILCGDFNISSNNQERYNELLGILACSNDDVSCEALTAITNTGDLTETEFTYDWQNNDLVPGEYEVTTLDYILVRKPKKFKPFEGIKRTIKVFTSSWSSGKLKNKRNLSDHHAVEITLLPAGK